MEGRETTCQQEWAEGGAAPARGSQACWSQHTDVLRDVPPRNCAVHTSDQTIRRQSAPHLMPAGRCLLLLTLVAADWRHKWWRVEKYTVHINAIQYARTKNSQSLLSVVSTVNILRRAKSRNTCTTPRVGRANYIFYPVLRRTHSNVLLRPTHVLKKSRRVILNSSTIIYDRSDKSLGGLNGVCTIS
jgi:hypothetical protein